MRYHLEIAVELDDLSGEGLLQPEVLADEIWQLPLSVGLIDVLGTLANQGVLG
jgi:hypothetical protein